MQPCPRKRSKRELNHITEGQETLRQGSEAGNGGPSELGGLCCKWNCRILAMTTETARRGAYSTLLALFPGQQVIRPT